MDKINIIKSKYIYFYSTILYMSLSVLKRKAGTKYNKISSRGNVGFSLNNPRRVDSHRNKVQTQTPMKGNVPRGHGTCCGKYPIVINKSQYANYDSHEREYLGEKSNQGISVKNHNGSISTRHKWMKRGYPHFVVKNTTQLDYGLYIKKLRDQSASQNEATQGTTNQNCDCPNIKRTVTTIVKNVNTLSHSEYLSSKFLTKKCLPTPKNKLHLPVPVSGPCSGCGSAACINSGTKGTNCGSTEEEEEVEEEEVVEEEDDDTEQLAIIEPILSSTGVNNLTVSLPGNYDDYFGDDALELSSTGYDALTTISVVRWKDYDGDIIVTNFVPSPEIDSSFVISWSFNDVEQNDTWNVRLDYENPTGVIMSSSIKNITI